MNILEEAPTEIYSPSYGITLDKVTQTQIRLGIQGYPGEGKTWAALTFPNPIVANIDRGLGAHIGRKDVIELPFYDPTFNKRFWSTEPDNIKEAIYSFLKQEAPKLKENQTLVIDALTGLDSAYHNDWKKHPAISKRSGSVDDYAEYGLKISYFRELHDLIIPLKCHVILITHEQDERKKGELTGKLRPLMSGQFGDQIVGKYTDWFRAMSASKPKDFDKVDEASILANWKMTKSQFKDMCDSFDSQSFFYWQTYSDDIFSGKCSSLVGYPKYIPANYQTFQKYRRKY